MPEKKENIQEQKELDDYDMSHYKQTPIDVEVDDKIIDIKKGKAVDFYSEEYWSATTMTKSQIAEVKDTKAIEIITEKGAKLTIILPETEMVHPKAVLGKWLKKYGKAPELNMRIKTKIDQNGFYRIIL